MGRRRPTIADIAARTGLSAGAVSYALNGRPGVSDATRARVLAVADEIGWTPNTAARALSGVGADAVGLVINRPARVLGLEPFFMEFVAGVQSVLAERDVALLLQVVGDAETETQTYRRWWSGGRVDGVFLVDVRRDDPRAAVLAELGLPGVVVGDPSCAGGLASVWSDDSTAMEQAVRHLVDLGHVRLARVAGDAAFAHTQIRTEAFVRTAGELGALEALVVDTDFSQEQGADATRSLLSRDRPPTALVFDNAVMAVAGLAVADGAGLAVPADLSVLAWDDSPLCLLTRPPLTAMRRDVGAYGADAARLLFAVLDGAVPASCRSNIPTWCARGSTGPAPATA